MYGSLYNSLFFMWLSRKLKLAQAGQTTSLDVCRQPDSFIFAVRRIKVLWEVFPVQDVADS